ncbi:MAG: cell division protein FtsA [Syntrophomonadaceae bacterium]|nr:cell division protein FtsA [Syntrophomonadaceae bacterium]
MENQKLLALDIGTRKIIGVVMEKTDAGYCIIASDMREHTTRSMMDGQIHDVEAVAANLLLIKNTLEAAVGKPLEKASVAAAGRSLKTSRGTCRKKRIPFQEISREEVTALEIEAVQQAQYNLTQENTNENNHLFCIGYSVVQYWLENQPIGSLIGQVGAETEVEIIATFLPRVVVDSLLSVLRRVGLSVYSLTLEPIAALAVAIPSTMRMLNLALVDIGAGTSDIALVRDGNIFSYAMVPNGGDEITETLAAKYLLDFNIAELLKRRLTSEETVQFADVLGNEISAPSKEVLITLQPKTEELATQIADNILRLNQKPPDAVICVGGGSLTPGLTEIIARNLEIPANRIGIRTPQAFEDIVVDIDYLRGPQGVTPLGIAYHALTIPPIPFIKVLVNNREIALWNTGNLTVAAALLGSGISLVNIYGKPGMGKTIEINGAVKVFKGEIGTAPLIRVNNEEASLETIINDGDTIEFVRGIDGNDARILVKDLLPSAAGSVIVNGSITPLQPIAKVDGNLLELTDELPDRCKVEFSNVNSIENILSLSGVPDHLMIEKVYNYTLNGQPMLYRWTPVKVKADGKEADLKDSVEVGANLEYSVEKLRPQISDILTNGVSPGINITVNEQPVFLEARTVSVYIDGKAAELQDELQEGTAITINERETSAILSDIFRVINLEPYPGGKLIMRVDDNDAGFTTPITEGSKIQLIWE